MRRTGFLLASLMLVLLIPSAASAATADADVRRQNGVTAGEVTFTAAPGERNRLTITSVRGRVVFRDAGARVIATGACEQVSADAASCPSSEDVAAARLGDGDDRARVGALVRVSGGTGDDDLRGGPGTDFLAGDAGDDRLSGGGNGDELNGGPGRDRVYGGSGDDRLIDGETDARAARDLYRGGDSRDTIGPDRGDTIDYAQRRRSIRIDLGRRRNDVGDRILGLESIVGGRGDDRLTGDGDDNVLEGEGGDDTLRGRAGDDIPMGGAGRDDLDGEAGDDVVWGNGGQDALAGGDGDDSFIAVDASGGERVACGAGRDVVRTRPANTLEDCEVSTYGSIYVEVRPRIAGGVATFRVACQRPGGCDGEIVLAALDGAELGRGAFADLPDDPQTFTAVPVALTRAGVETLRAGAVVQTTYGSNRGHRAFLRGG